MNPQDGGNTRVPQSSLEVPGREGAAFVVPFLSTKEGEVCPRPPRKSNNQAGDALPADWSGDGEKELLEGS